LRGDCTVIENAAGYYLSKSNEIIDDRVSVVYCDFPLNWNRRAERAEASNYCTGLQGFLLDNLWQEEAILVAAHPVSHTE
jgi:hypothetical protein